ncbi:MAG: xanthine dehydrogenase small subunit [Bacteroidetes bacterium]|nr:MAG: xanthine dehydrogenase small subunit [Bacteroidota bacterium]
MKSSILKFLLNDRLVETDFAKTSLLPSTTVLNYLRMNRLIGTKEGCAEGDCGACTVTIAELVNDKLVYKAVNSCLMFLSGLQGKQLITIEHLSENAGNNSLLHPVQEAMINHHASQCGFCTPGMTMMIFSKYKSKSIVNPAQLRTALAGNLCRCTGYVSILDAANEVLANRAPDLFSMQEPEIVSILRKLNDGNSHFFNSENQCYYLPCTLEDALDFRISHPEAIIVNGATDTAIKQNKQFEYQKCFLDLSAVECLTKIEETEKEYIIGSGCTITALKEFAAHNYQVMLPVLEVFASEQIRNVATVGGNLSTASPIGDLLPMFIALGAEVEIASLSGRRKIYLEEFLTGYRSNALNKDEILTAVVLSKVSASPFCFFEKASVRKQLDITTVNIAVCLELDPDSSVKTIRLVYGGMAAMVKRVKAVEDFCKEKKWSKQLVEDCFPMIDSYFQPISDARANASTRSILAQNLFLKAWVQSTANKEMEDR